MTLAPARLAQAVAVLAIAAVAALHARGLAAGFLSDDYGILVQLAQHERAGTLGAWLLDLWAAPLRGSGNHGLRPLGFLSFALDWRLWGARPAGWHLTGLLLHLASAALAGRLAWRWLAPDPQARAAALYAAALYAAYPFAAEATTWVAARFDLLAALFALLFLATFDGTRAGAGRHALRIALLYAALLSKESALPVVAIAVAAAFALARGGLSLRARAAFALRDAAPMLAAFALYLGWRTALVGASVGVYPDSRLPQSLAEYLGRLATLGELVTRQTSATPSWTFALVAGVLLAALAATAAAAADRIGRRAWLVAGVAALGVAAYLLAPPLSLVTPHAGGEASRNYLIGWGCASGAFGALAVATSATRLAAVAFLAWCVVGQAGGLAQWHAAGRTMRDIVRAVPAFAQGVPADGYALLLLPDRIGAVVFARNAQSGIVTRPAQQQDHLDRVAGMTKHNFADWKGNFAAGVVAGLKRGAAYDPARFQGAFCWQRDARRFVRVGPAGPIGDYAAWEAAVRADVPRAGCLAGTVDG